jgi:hypothetical protein
MPDTHNSTPVHWLLLLQVLARHVNPEQMLEVVHLNEVLAEAQRGAAAANAAVAAVDKVSCWKGLAYMHVCWLWGACVMKCWQRRSAEQQQQMQQYGS